MLQAMVFLESKLITQEIMKRYFPSAFLAILGIINTGIATILSVLSNLKIG